MMQRLLFVSLCLLLHPLIALETKQDTSIPLETAVYKTSLANGIKVYIQEFAAPQQWGSFRVVFKHPSLEHVLYAFDSKTDEWGSVGEFFIACAEKALEGNDTLIRNHYPSSLSSILNPTTPQDMAVIAVGNFSKEEMLSLIEESFSDVELDNNPSSEPIQINYSEELKPSQVAINVSLPNHYRPIHTFGDLKECWKALFLQELLQQRFEECAKGFEETWVHPHPHNFYPVNGFALVPEEETENILAFFLWHLEMLGNQGFYSDSFLAKKRELLHQLYYLAAQADFPTPAFLASYYKDQFLLGDYTLNHNDFLKASVDCVQEIQFDDLLPLLDLFVDKCNRKIHLVYSTHSHRPPLTEEKIQDLTTQIESLAELYRNNEGLDENFDDEEVGPVIVKSNLAAKDLVRFADNRAPVSFRLINQKDTPSDPFYELTLSDQDKECISYIISTMAANNVIELAFRKHALEKKGKKIEHVHPLRFMSFVLSTPSLKADLKVVKKSAFKWDAVIDGFSRRMREEMGNNNVCQYIPAFAALVGSTPEHVNSFVRQNDWEGLIKSLL